MNLGQEYKLEAFGSDNCHDLQYWQRLFVSGTNLMFIAPMWRLLEKRVRIIYIWPELSQIAATMIFSYIYHLCDDADGNSPCFRVCSLEYANLYKLDFIFSHQIISVCLFYGLRLEVKGVCALAWFVVNMTYFGYWQDNNYNDFVVAQLMMGVFVYCVRCTMREGHVWRILRDDAIAGASFLPWVFLALVCKIVGNFVFYDFFHGCWHISIAIALYKFVLV